MPRGDKGAYTDKQKRQAEHIEESYEDRGVSEGEAGGYKEVTAAELLEKHPERILEMAVKRMVPRNRLGRAQMQKLKIYAGPNHPHQAQQPKELKLEL